MAYGYVSLCEIRVKGKKPVGVVMYGKKESGEILSFGQGKKHKIRTGQRIVFKTVKLPKVMSNDDILKWLKGEGKYLFKKLKEFT